MQKGGQNKFILTPLISYKHPYRAPGFIPGARFKVNYLLPIILPSIIEVVDLLLHKKDLAIRLRSTGSPGYHACSLH